MATDSKVGRLTFFEIAEDGASVRMHMEDSKGWPLSLEFPLEHVISLAMTLPNMVTAAAQRSHRDESKRVTYPLDNFRLERDADLTTSILTLATSGGFAGSFSLSANQCHEIGSALTPRPATTNKHELLN